MRTKRRMASSSRVCCSAIQCSSRIVPQRCTVLALYHTCLNPAFTMMAAATLPCLRQYGCNICVSHASPNCPRPTTHSAPVAITSLTLIYTGPADDHVLSVGPLRRGTPAKVTHRGCDRQTPDLLVGRVA